MFEATFGRYLMILECFKDSYMNTTFLHFDIYIYILHVNISIFHVTIFDAKTTAHKRQKYDIIKKLSTKKMHT